MLSEATTFATLVGLLSQFVSGRDNKSTSDVVEFTNWLIKHNHNDLVTLIEQNNATNISIKSLLNCHADELKQLLSSLIETTATIASRLPELDKLTKSLLPNLELSDQAFSILEQMYDSKAEYFLVSHAAGVAPQLIQSKGPSIQITDEQFLKDDISTLVDLDLLRQDYNSQGNEMYYFTRLASKIVSCQPT